jgi:broad specificity phosphatase PhoE
MRLFLLRHEERPKEVGFYTELTEEGKKKSINKIKQLEELNIDKIFCSPFIRCVQTIEPFCLKYNKNINIDCALGEYPYNESKERMSHPVKFLEIINTDYIPVLSNFPFYEILKDLEERVKNFCTKILIKYYGTNLNVLVVSHKSILNTIEHYVTNASGKLEIQKEFPMGHLTRNVLKK